MAEGITYRREFDLWWPDYDHNSIACHKRVTRRVRDLDLAISLCSHPRATCVQAGGHAGVWPIHLARHFANVYTFEPEPALFACLQRNVARTGEPFGIISSSKALGARDGKASMRPHISAGSWRIDPLTGSVEVDMTTIDGLKIKRCDLIVLDVEGYEVEALKGATQTIRAHRPVLHVEELDRSKDAIRAHMKAIGYRLVKRIHSDAVYISG